MKFWTPVEVTGWIAQSVAILWLFRKDASRSDGWWRGPEARLALALALCLGWAWRLVYQFVLASSGFWYFVADDPCRWLLAYGWSREPFLITWDGIWQGATFYLHGLAMR